jgi:PAS domain S-box-containing protein
MQDRLREAVKKAASGEIIFFEATHLAADKSLHYIDFSLKPVKDQDGKIIFLLPEGRDITERKRYEEELKKYRNHLEELVKEKTKEIEESEVRFKTIFEYAKDGILLADIENKRFSMCNKTICDMLGRREEEMKQLSVNDIHPEKELLHIIELFEKQARGEFTTMDGLPLKRKDGSILYVDITSSMVTLSGKKYLMGIFRDVTERKNTEAVFMEAVKTKTTFIGTVSHELRTPLAAIKEGVSVVLDEIVGNINEDQQKYLKIVNNNVDRLSRLIDGVLDFQTLESGKMEFNIEDNDMNEVVKEMWQEMLPLADKKNLYFLCQLCENLPRIRFDHDKIIQVLTNLLNNAFKFTENGGITFNVSRGDNFVQVMVKDTGIGIKEENMQKLFQEFTQLQRKVGGTGLGLSICKKIMEAHKGKIWAESEFGKGTTFYFSLPIKERRA